MNSTTTSTSALDTLANIADHNDQMEHKYDSPDEKTSQTLPNTNRKRKRSHKYQSLSNADREHIISLSINNTSATQIARSLNISRNTVYNVLRTLHKENRVTKKRKGGRKKQYVEQDRKILAEIQDENNEITYSQLRQIWKDATGNYDKKLANGTIHKILTEENISTKNLYHEPRERNTPQNIEERKTYCLWAAKAAQDAIVFLDETGFNLHTHRRRGRSRIGKRATITQPAQRGGNLSLIVALHATRGIIKWRVKIGSISSDEYARFLNELLQEPAMQLRTHYFIQDNVSFHRSASVLQCFEGTRIQHIQKFVPAYSPQLNAIEECFSKIHRFVDSKQKDDRWDLFELIEQGVNSVTPADADAWYRHLMRYYIECAAGKPLKDAPAINE